MALLFPKKKKYKLLKLMYVILFLTPDFLQINELKKMIKSRFLSFFLNMGINKMVSY